MKKYRAEFIGRGYECVQLLIVEAENEGEAIKKAWKEYEKLGWLFWFDYIEVKEAVIEKLSKGDMNKNDFLEYAEQMVLTENTKNTAN